MSAFQPLATCHLNFTDVYLVPKLKVFSKNEGYSNFPMLARTTNGKIKSRLINLEKMSWFCSMQRSTEHWGKTLLENIFTIAILKFINDSQNLPHLFGIFIRSWYQNSQEGSELSHTCFPLGRQLRVPTPDLRPTYQPSTLPAHTQTNPGGSASLVNEG